MVNAQHLDSLNAEQLRALAKALIDQAASRKELLAGKDRQAKIDQLTHEMAVLKRWKFGRSGERLDPPQRSSTRSSMRTSPLSKWNSRAWHPRPEPSPRRASPDAPGLPRVEITHKPESTVCTTPGCGCALKRIGEDVSEKLDYMPGVFTVERHVRGKWACVRCQTLTQAPVPAQIIDEGIPTAGLLAQVAKWPSTRITCRCTGEQISLRAPAWRWRAPRWAPGWACAAFNSNPWSMP